MPQALAAMSLKLTMPLILKRFGYRSVLVANTLVLGIMIMLFATIDVATPVWLIVAMAFTYGFLTSLQYTSMNTLAYADVGEREVSNASTIASTVQQMAVSFGIATASLAAALFIPDRLHASAPQMIHGIHLALLGLAMLTVVSTSVFWRLRAQDGAAVSRHKPQIPA
jgi:MFS family permease